MAKFKWKKFVFKPLILGASVIIVGGYVAGFLTALDVIPLKVIATSALLGAGLSVVVTEIVMEKFKF